jgi:hypothetical protein
MPPHTKLTRSTHTHGSLRRLARAISSMLLFGVLGGAAGCSTSKPAASDESDSETTPRKKRPKTEMSASSSTASSATASAAVAPAAPTWTVPRAPSDMPSEGDWESARADVETSPEGKSTMCAMRLLREWVAIRCSSGISLITQQLELGKAGTDYVVGTASGATTFIRLRPGVAGYARFASNGDKTAHFSYSWAESEPAPRYLLLSDKDRHHEVLTRADTKGADEPPAIAAPLAARPKLGDWSIATRLTGGPSAPNDCAVLALQDWLRIQCKKAISNDTFDQYAFTPLEGLGEKGKDYFPEMKGLVGTELVVELRMAKGTQRAKIQTSPVTGNHHMLTVEWPEGDARPKSLVLAGNVK